MSWQRTAIATALAGAMVPAAVAADELDELKAQLEYLQKRIEQLERRQVQQAAPEPVTTEERPAVAPGNTKVRLGLSGQVNRALLAVDDGAQSEVHHVDNDASSTRFRLIGEVDPRDNLTVGAALEVQFESNSSADVSQQSGGDASANNFTERRLELYFDHRQGGRLWLGQGWTASEGTSELDLSGTDLAGYSDSDASAGGMLFRDGATGALTGPAVKAVFNNLDGQGRQDRIRYDTPSFSGFMVSLGHLEDDGWDTAIRYNADYRGTKVVGALAYSEPARSTAEQVNGSLSVLWTSGVSFTFAAGEQNHTGVSTPNFYYGKLGYQGAWNPLGKTFFSVDFHRSQDGNLSGDEGTVYGLQAVQAIDDWSTEGYIGLRNYELDRPGRSFDDITALMAGARLKF